jgi:hypothetical protein
VTFALFSTIMTSRPSPIAILERLSSLISSGNNVAARSSIGSSPQFVVFEWATFANAVRARIQIYDRATD